MSKIVKTIQLIMKITVYHSSRYFTVQFYDEAVEE